MSVKVNITFSCNSECLYCNTAKPNSSVIDPIFVGKVFSDMAINSEIVYFTGGECTLYPKVLVECLATSKSRENRNILVTNGIIFFEDSNIDEVFISIDGPYEFSNCFRYGKKNHDVVITNLKHYMGLYEKVTIQCVIHPMNVNRFFEVDSYLKEFGCKINYHLYTGKWYTVPPECILKGIAKTNPLCKPCFLCKTPQIVLNPDMTVLKPCLDHILKIDKTCSLWKECDQIGCVTCSDVKKKLLQYRVEDYYNDK